MDPNTPTSQQPNNGLIMPDQPAVAAEPAPVTPSTPVAVPTPATPPVSAAPVSVDGVTSVAAPSAPEPIVPPAPTVAAEPVAAPQPPVDPLFEPVTEPDPADPVPGAVLPTPAEPVSDQAMKTLDDGPQPVVTSTGQTVVASSKPHKSRRKTMLVLLLGLLLLGGIGYAVYAYFMKPNVTQTSTPSAIVSVDQLSPENLTQATDKAELAAGSQTNTTSLIISGTAPTDAPSNVKLQIEVQPLGTDFTGTPLEDTVAVPDTADPMKLKLSNYAAGSYHWRARLSDGAASGPWVTYNTDDTAGKTADFVIDRTAPAAATVSTLNGRKVASTKLTSTAAQPVFAGTAEAGSSVTVAFGTAASYKATTAADGSWTVTAGAALTNGTYTVTITVADAAGNTAAKTYTLTQSAK